MNEEIEKHIPPFLWYRVINDPFNPTIHFRFGDYALAVALIDDIDAIFAGGAVLHKLRAGLPHDHQVIWDWLVTNDTSATVMKIDSKMTGITFAPQGGETIYHDLINLHLRDKDVRAAYVEETNTIVVSDNYYFTMAVKDE